MTRARCPHCGRPMKDAPKYADPVAREQGRRATLRANVERRARQDLRAWALVPTRFYTRDVGEALRCVGRNWSEFQAMMNRAMARGWIGLDAPSAEGVPRRWVQTRVLRKAIRATG